MAKYSLQPGHNHDEVYAKIGEGGVTDHGALAGLTDNDHPQYLLTTAIVEVNGHRIVVDTDHVQLIKKMKG